MKLYKSLLGYLLIAVIAIVTTVPSYAQTAAAPQKDIRSSFALVQQERTNSLLNSQPAAINPLAQPNLFDKSPKMPQQRTWMRRNWWVIPVLIGVGVGGYYLYKNYRDSGIRCNDGWISHAENRQGACSSHGGIAPGY